MRAELHDIGKLALPDAILHKPAPLDEAEWAFMRRHPEIGQRIVGPRRALADVGVLIRASHERWDGSGYPDGLRGEEIPIGARIVAACDAYDAMRAARPYASPMTDGAALAELWRGAGSQFDPAVVEAFCTVLNRASRRRRRRRRRGAGGLRRVAPLSARRENRRAPRQPMRSVYWGRKRQVGPPGFEPGHDGL